MKYRVSFYNAIEERREEKVFEAEAADFGLGQKIIDWVDETYEVDSDTDGTDVWYTNADGEQAMALTGIEIDEIKAELGSPDSEYINRDARMGYLSTIYNARVRAMEGKILGGMENPPERIIVDAINEVRKQI